jgi:hypothetical protein
LGSGGPILFDTVPSTPHCTTKYRPFYLLHGREMNLPTTEDLKAKISQDVQSTDQVQRLENLMSSLAKAYEAVRRNSRKSHQVNKCWYDRKAKDRQFEVSRRSGVFVQCR